MSARLHMATAHANRVRGRETGALAAPLDDGDQEHPAATADATSTTSPLRREIVYAAAAALAGDLLARSLG